MQHFTRPLTIEIVIRWPIRPSVSSNITILLFRTSAGLCLELCEHHKEHYHSRLVLDETYSLAAEFPVGLRKQNVNEYRLRRKGRGTSVHSVMDSRSAMVSTRWGKNCFFRFENMYACFTYILLPRTCRLFSTRCPTPGGKPQSSFMLVKLHCLCDWYPFWGSIYR
jgi:hypothetical protein